MRRLILFLSFALATTLSWAVKAHPLPFTIVQSDGTTLTVKAHGDEDMHWVATTDGVLLVRVDGNYYVAKVNEDGSLSATTQLAHNRGSRNMAEQKLVAAQNLQAFYKTAEQKAQKARAKRVGQAPIMTRANEIGGSTYFPHKGSPKALVILVDFPDVPFTIREPKQAFDQYLNSATRPEDLGHGENSNVGSVRKYFSDMSFGQFTPQFDVVGPVTVSQNLAYYGGSDPDGKDEKASLLMEEACKLVDDEVDFTQYAFSEGSKNILVYIIYAGFSQSFASNPNYCLWPKSWSGISQKFDGMSIVRCGINNELNGYEGAFTQEPLYRINGIGLFCHEFSHCMGLPDFYPTVASSRDNNQAMEYWSLMDEGEYANNGYRPTAYTAWEREAFGWMTIETLDQDQTGIEAIPIDNEGGKAFRIVNDNDATGNEYYILQNIQQKKWNGGAKGHGLLVYHVNYNASNFTGNTVNNVKGKPRMSIVPADGLLLTSYKVDDETITSQDYYNELAGDPFPGTQNVTALNDTMNIVNFKPYTGTVLNKALRNITETDGVVTFDFMSDFATGIRGVRSIRDEADKHIFTIDGKYVGTDSSKLGKGVYIIGRRKMIVR